MKKSTRIVRIVLQVLVSLSFVAAALAKLTHNAQEVQLFNSVHLESTIVIIGLLEILAAVLVWFKSTRLFAVLLASAIMGAAFAETISVGMANEVFAPGLVLVLFWVIAFLDRRSCTCACEGCKDCAVKNTTV